MNKKFVYCMDEDLSEKLIKQLELIATQIINNKRTWVFENNNKITFSEIDIDKLKFTNKLYI